MVTAMRAHVCVCVSADRDAVGLLPVAIHHCQSVRDGVAARAQVSDARMRTRVSRVNKDFLRTSIVFFTQLQFDLSRIFTIFEKTLFTVFINHLNIFSFFSGTGDTLERESIPKMLAHSISSRFCFFYIYRFLCLSCLPLFSIFG